MTARITGRIAFWIALAWSAPALAASDKPSFVHDGRIDVCTSGNFPPLTYVANATDSQPQGIDIDIADALAARWGATVRFLTSNFDGILPSLQSGRCALAISGMYVNEERLRTYAAVPYLLSAPAIVTDSGEKAIHGPADLSGQSVAMEAGSSSLLILQKLNAQFSVTGRPPIRISTYPTQVDATQQVLGGRVNATITETAEAGVRVKQSAGRLKLAYTFPAQEHYGIYLRKNHDDQVAIRNGLRDLKENGVLKRIALKYNLPESSFDISR
ncbi:hypothetical protein C5O80_31225 [Burkholderia sp. SRS-46]|nr:hypothetical protein C5O80_31225 [Burkholderia sp. SRS-46]